MLKLGFLFHEVIAGQHSTIDLLIAPAAPNPDAVAPAHSLAFIKWLLIKAVLRCTRSYTHILPIIAAGEYTNRALLVIFTYRGPYLTEYASFRSRATAYFEHHTGCDSRSHQYPSRTFESGDLLAASYKF